MRKLDTYLIRELMVPFLIGTVAVVLMFQANLLIALYKEPSFNNVPTAAVFKFILLKTPFFLNMTLPVGMSLASSLAVSRLVRETELTALRAAGISILRVVAPIAVFGLLVSFLNLWLVERVMPASERRAEEVQRNMAIVALPQFKSKVMIDFPKYTASIEEVRRESNNSLLLKGVLLIERRGLNEVVLWTADTGTYRRGVWTLQNTYMRMITGDTLTMAKPDKDVVINEEITIESIMGNRPSPEQTTATMLRKQIAEQKKLKLDTTALEVAYHVKFSVPAACFVFALTGPVFAVTFARGGAFIGVFLSIILVLVYFNAFIIFTQIFGRTGWLPPIFAAWGPNLIFFSFGLLFLRRAE